MEQLKIVFVQCQGMGLQIDGSLIRIPSSVFHENVQASTAYLIDAKGNILCTILQNRLDYESNQNQDRRIRNKENGFELVWAKDGNCCCVYYNNINRQSVNFSVGKIIIFLLVGMLLGGVISSWIWYAGFQAKSVGDAFMSQSVQEKNQKLIIKNLIIQRDSLSSVIVSKNQQLLYLRDSLSLIIEKQRKLNKEEFHVDSIRKVASAKRHLLQSMACDAYRVSEVRVWWKELEQKEKEIVSPIYNFDVALTVYNQFFNCRDEHDLLALYAKGQTVFSPTQLRVINRLIKSHCPKDLFRKKLVGMNFLHIERIIGES